MTSTKESTLGAFFSAVKIRFLLVLVLVHVGLALGLFALGRLSFPNGWDLTSSLLLGSVVCLYGGFILGCIFILVPLIPWIRRARRVEHWSERLVSDLPLLLEQLPKILAAFQSLIAIWNEAKSRTQSERTQAADTVKSS